MTDKDQLTNVDRPLVEVVPIESLQPDPHNANRGTERGSYMLNDSLVQRGAGRSILTTGDGVILAGNKTHEQAVQAGFTEVIKVHTNGTQLVAVVRDDLEHGSAEATRLAIEDNRIGQVSLEFDPAVLLAMGKEDEALFDGLWRDDELEELLAGLIDEDDEPPPPAQMDKADELQQKWGTVTGQIWELGEHRLAVGDCTDGVILPRLVQDTVIDLLLTDPPYGVDWDTDYTRFTTEYGGKRIKHPPIVNDNKPFDPTPWMHYPQVILWGANWYCQHIPMGTWLVWDKRHASGEAFLSDAELAWQKGKRGVYIYAETVQGAHRKEKASHPTQKPVGLMGWCIGRYEDVSTVLDPYLGSGTTLIAAHQLGRKCYAVEILPAYAAVSIQRWVDLTGLEPIRIGDSENA